MSSSLVPSITKSNSIEIAQPIPPMGYVLTSGVRSDGAEQILIIVQNLLAEAGAYFALVQILSWIVSGLACAR